MQTDEREVKHQELPPRPQDLTFVSFYPEVKAVDLEARTAEHIISTDSIDRSNDVIEQDGWDLTEYQKNPIVLADHSYKVDSIIGRAKTITIKQHSMHAVTEFHDFGIGAKAFELVQAGMARAWSVGFRGLDGHSIREGQKLKCKKCKATYSKLKGDREEDDIFVVGRHFTKQRLYEYSLVAIPANPDAVMSYCKQFGIEPREAETLFAPADTRRLDQLEVAFKRSLEAQEIILDNIHGVLKQLSDNSPVVEALEKLAARFQDIVNTGQKTSTHFVTGMTSLPPSNDLRIVFEDDPEQEQPVNVSKTEPLATSEPSEVSSTEASDEKTKADEAKRQPVTIEQLRHTNASRRMDTMLDIARQLRQSTKVNRVKTEAERVKEKNQR